MSCVEFDIGELSGLCILCFGRDSLQNTTAKKLQPKKSDEPLY